MSRIVNKMLTQNNNNNNDKSDSRRYVLIVVDQLSQLRHNKMNVINIIIREKKIDQMR
jgi:hypothetical protein